MVMEGTDTATRGTLTATEGSAATAAPTGGSTGGTRGVVALAVASVAQISGGAVALIVTGETKVGGGRSVAATGALTGVGIDSVTMQGASTAMAEAGQGEVIYEVPTARITITPAVTGDTETSTAIGILK